VLLAHAFIFYDDIKTTAAYEQARWLADHPDTQARTARPAHDPHELSELRDADDPTSTTPMSCDDAGWVRAESDGHCRIVGSQPGVHVCFASGRASTACARERRVRTGRRVRAVIVVFVARIREAQTAFFPPSYPFQISIARASNNDNRHRHEPPAGTSYVARGARRSPRSSSARRRPAPPRSFRCAAMRRLKAERAELAREPTPCACRRRPAPCATGSTTGASSSTSRVDPTAPKREEVPAGWLATVVPLR